MSNEVKRYVCRQGEMHVFNSSNPNVFQYVDAADYDALLAERDRLREEMAELLEALENLLAVREGKGGTKYHADDIARAAIAKARGG